MGEAPESPLEPYWASEDVTLYLGDCLDVLRGLPDGSIDAIVTDPPYNLSFMSKPWDAFDGQEDAGFAYWLAGLIDGEGHFAIKAHARGTHAPAFSLKLRADEHGTLDLIRRKTGIGSISYEDREPNPMAKWVVQDKVGCQRLCDLLDKYPLRAKKKADYWTWREAVCEWTSRPRGNRWHGKADNSRMAGLRDRLMNGRAYTDIPWSGNEFQDWCRLWAAECLRVLKPGGHLLAFGGTRTWHRLTCAIEDAGFEIRDCTADLTGIDGPGLLWLYGSGFPKSLDVSKAIDKAAGAEREAIGDGQPFGRGSMRNRSRVEMGYRPTEINPEGGIAKVTAPATEDAARWSGWGTALKPSWEPIVVARKPLTGTVAQNVLQHGTGALNTDGCRVGTEPAFTERIGRKSVSGLLNGTGDQRVTSGGDGRWPPNVVLGPAAAEELDRQSGVLTSGANPTRRGSDKFRDAYGEFAGQEECTPHRGVDSGGASRFFPVFKYEAKAGTAERPRLEDGTAHPTVKPVDLMAWLVRLVTPPGGLVLDPFAGSGTTAEACIVEGFSCVLIEQDPKSAELIKTRLSKPIQPAMLAVDDSAQPTRPHPVAAASRPKPSPEAHPSLFEDLDAAS